MTVNTTSSRTVTSGNGTTKPFPTGFEFNAAATLVVTLVTIATGAEVLKAINTDYTVTGGLGNDGTVHMIVAPTLLEILVVERAEDQTQQTDYTRNDPFPSEVNETALDKLTFLIQEGLDKINRAIRFRKSTTLTHIEIPDPEVDKVLVGKSGPIGFENKFIEDLAINAIEVPVPVSKGGTNSTTPAAARAALGPWSDILVTAAGSTTARSLAARFAEYFNVTDYGAVANGVTDDTVAIQAAVDAAVANGGGTVQFPIGTCQVSAGGFTVSGSNAIILRGAGGLAGGSHIRYTGTTGDVATFSGVQHCGFENIYMTYANKPTSGFGVVFSNCFSCHIDNFRGDRLYNGVDVSSSTETRVGNIQLRQLYGLFGVKFVGTDGARSYRCIIDDFVGDNPYPEPSGMSSASVKTWAIDTAFDVGDVINQNNNIYQCLVAGTSAGAGGGPSGGDFDTNVIDGTAEWRFVSQTILGWIIQDSFAYSLVIDKAACLNAGKGYEMKDTLNTGTSYPVWCFASGLEADHSFGSPVRLNRGEGFYASNSWWGSSLTSNGLDILSTFRGEGSITTTRIVGNAQNGILLNNGPVDMIIDGNIIGDNSTLGSGTYHGILVAAETSRFQITDNRIGNIVGIAGNSQGYGVLVIAGASDDYIITSNNLRGNVTGGLSDAGTGTNKQIYGNLPLEAGVDNFVLGGGAAITGHLSATASLVYSQIPAHTVAAQGVSVPGAALGDTVVVSPNGTPGTVFTWFGRVSVAGTVEVLLQNMATGAYTPDTVTWRVDIWKH